MLPDEMTLKQKIKHVYKDLSAKKRNDETIIVCADGELKDLIREAHQGIFPNDWIFDKVDSILSSVLDYDFNNLNGLDNYKHEIIDGLVDIYTGDLFEWAKRFKHFVDDAKSEGLIDGSAEIEQQLQGGQFYHIEQIFNTVINGINDLDLDTEEAKTLAV